MVKRHQNHRRPHRVEVSFSDSEYEDLVNKKRRASNGQSLSCSTFIRNAILEEEMTVLISEEDRLAIAALQELQKDIRSLIEISRKERLVNHTLHLERIEWDFRKAIDVLIRKLSV